MAQTMLPCSEETLSALHGLVPGLSEVPDEQKLEKLLQYIQAEALPSVSVAAEPDQANLSLTAPDPAIGQALFEAVKAKRDLCVSRGALTPAVADALLARLAPDDQLIGLSRDDGADATLALSIFTSLAENRPVPLGERSGSQARALARAVPGETRPQGQPLYEKMAAMADGKCVEL